MNRDEREALIVQAVVFVPMVMCGVLAIVALVLGVSPAWLMVAGLALFGVGIALAFVSIVVRTQPSRSAKAGVVATALPTPVLLVLAFHFGIRSDLGLGLVASSLGLPSLPT